MYARSEDLLYRFSRNEDNDRNGVVPNYDGDAFIGVIRNASVGLIKIRDHRSVVARKNIAEARHWC